MLKREFEGHMDTVKNVTMEPYAIVRSTHCIYGPFCKTLFYISFKVNNGYTFN